MNFVPRDSDDLLKNSKSPSTRAKTSRDVDYFHQFLDEIAGVKNQPMETLPQDELVKHLCTF